MFSNENKMTLYLLELKIYIYIYKKVKFYLLCLYAIERNKIFSSFSSSSSCDMKYFKFLVLERKKSVNKQIRASNYIIIKLVVILIF
jgi:hypothetical protein